MCDDQISAPVAPARPAATHRPIADAKCTLDFLASVLGLPDDCRLVGIRASDDDRVVVLEIEGKGLPPTPQPVYTMHFLDPDKRPHNLVRISVAWQHDPSREWDHIYLFDYDKWRNG